MYGVPDTSDFPTQVFTLFFYVFGSTLLAGAVGAFATSVVDSVTKEERRRQKDFPSDLDLDGRIGMKDWLYFYGDNFLIKIGWYQNQEKFLTVGFALVWLVFGILFSIHHLEMDVFEAFYFSLGAISAAGLAPPPCTSPDGDDGDENCKIEQQTAVFMICYLIIGVPLFTLSLGQFSLSVVERAVRVREREMMMRPLTEEEFSYACSLNDKGQDEDNRGTIDFSEFVVCEMLRLKRVDVEEIEQIRELFSLIDYDDTGIISREKLSKAHLFFQNLEYQRSQSFGNTDESPALNFTYSSGHDTGKNATSPTDDSYITGTGNAPVLLDVRHVASHHRRLSLSSTSNTEPNTPLDSTAMSGVSERVAQRFHEKVAAMREKMRKRSIHR
jgi:hypothetical protein